MLWRLCVVEFVASCECCHRSGPFGGLVCALARSWCGRLVVLALARAVALDRFSLLGSAYASRLLRACARRSLLMLVSSVSLTRRIQASRSSLGFGSRLCTLVRTCLLAFTLFVRLG